MKSSWEAQAVFYPRLGLKKRFGYYASTFRAHKSLRMHKKKLLLITIFIVEMYASSRELFYSSFYTRTTWNNENFSFLLFADISNSELILNIVGWMIVIRKTCGKTRQNNGGKFVKYLCFVENCENPKVWNFYRKSDQNNPQKQKKNLWKISKQRKFFQSIAFVFSIIRENYETMKRS